MSFLQRLPQLDRAVGTRWAGWTRLQPRQPSVPLSAQTCPACGSGVLLDDHAVHYRGDAYHEDCALYRRNE